ncbi:alpha-L-fucosidase [Echinicola sp. CAU 1574]|uniref:alpha-L-fucosidase n=1 Tax=Echinicola arenosa TaxID=2774144 RepID=A0ABR9AL19_9BACT|nr:alpha-L-fucosidase [Echinicola arenosa]MBD8489509.1 alpha-L-fucosidase [Echinicola arenosa]
MKYKLFVVGWALLGFQYCQKAKAQEIPYAPTIAIDKDDSEDSIRIKAAHVIPTKNQYQALKDEFIAFVHFGPNTFTSKEWGSGFEDPAVFDLKKLDTDQWCEAMKAAGMSKVILTVKHHDGFVLWQSRYTNHGIMSTGFRDGKGDVLADLSASCKKYGLKLGVYLSPADLYQIENPEGLYGNLSKKTLRTIPRKIADRPFKDKTTFDFVVDDYNEYFLNQLFELLTEYGRIDEVWFDGAHPKRKGGQTYDYAAWKELIRELAPHAVIFGRQDIRWCGNESGKTRAIEWNVIPYEEDPNQMNRFADITGEDVASMEKLYTANYLHYQPAETNTSIREGWFYRNDDEQGVRSADDVFDIYERSVGGNSIFLLNIPPNREGKFSERDVKVLKEVGSRIKSTYGKSLLVGAHGPEKVLDKDQDTYVLLPEHSNELSFKLDKPIRLNRLMIQEAIQTQGERVAEFEVEAWLDGRWKVISKGKNIGYKSIQRFATVTTDRIRIRIAEARLMPVSISEVAAFYYETRPPQLDIVRDLEGKVSINAQKGDFGWKTYEQDIAGDLNRDLSIHYTLDGSDPTKESAIYKGPFEFRHGTIKAIAFGKEDEGALAEELFGLGKANWKVIDSSNAAKGFEVNKAFDEDVETYWKTEEEKPSGQTLVLDLGEEVDISGFTYSPSTNDKEGMIEEGKLYVSKDGKSWEFTEDFVFGNLINDPTKRRHDFESPVSGRYIKLEVTRIAGGQRHAAIAEVGILVK